MREEIGGAGLAGQILARVSGWISVPTLATKAAFLLSKRA